MVSRELRVAAPSVTRSLRMAWLTFSPVAALIRAVDESASLLAAPQRREQERVNVPGLRLPSPANFNLSVRGCGL